MAYTYSFCNLSYYVNNFSIRRNSGGNGLFNGGNGVVREIKFNQNMTAVILSNRRKVSPLGILDGENAKKGINILKTKNFPPLMNSLIPQLNIGKLLKPMIMPLSIKLFPSLEMT